jgi:hypothetical protein
MMFGTIRCCALAAADADLVCGIHNEFDGAAFPALVKSFVARHPGTRELPAAGVLALALSEGCRQ